MTKLLAIFGLLLQFLLLVSADNTNNKSNKLRLGQQEHRQLAVPNFSVTVTDISDQSIGFDTGTGLPDSSVMILVSDLCRAESAHRIEVGLLFPVSSVQGIQSDVTKIINDPGPNNVLSFRFVEGIAQNPDIYSPNSDGTTATVSFCVEIALLIGTQAVNFGEVKLTYKVNLVTKVGTLTEHSPI